MGAMATGRQLAGIGRLNGCQDKDVDYGYQRRSDQNEDMTNTNVITRRGDYQHHHEGDQ